jgi:hypothetical protein
VTRVLAKAGMNMEKASPFFDTDSRNPEHGNILVFLTRKPQNHPDILTKS